jgi:peptidoglycan/LPS O-acetylase OafA/YrhL
MPGISRFYFGMAILFLMTGITLGLAMAISQDHSLAPVHAHINLLGWVTSAIFGGYYALNPQKASGWLPLVQGGAYATGLLVMLPTLYYLYTGHPEIEPVLAAGSMATALGVLLFAAVVFTRGRERAPVLQPAE